MHLHNFQKYMALNRPKHCSPLPALIPWYQVTNVVIITQVGTIMSVNPLASLVIKVQSSTPPSTGFTTPLNQPPFYHASTITRNRWVKLRGREIKIPRLCLAAIRHEKTRGHGPLPLWKFLGSAEIFSLPYCIEMQEIIQAQEHRNQAFLLLSSQTCFYCYYGNKVPI